MIDNAAPRETHLGSAIPSQRTDGQPTGSGRIGAHRVDGPRATGDLISNDPIRDAAAEPNSDPADRRVAHRRSVEWARQRVGHRFG